MDRGEPREVVKILSAASILDVLFYGYLSRGPAEPMAVFSDINNRHCALLGLAQLHILHNKVDVLATVGGRGVGPLVEERSGRSPLESPVRASWLQSAVNGSTTARMTYRTS